MAQQSDAAQLQAMLLQMQADMQAQQAAHAQLVHQLQQQAQQQAQQAQQMQQAQQVALQAEQQAQQQAQQHAAAQLSPVVQMLALSALGQLARFDGKGTASAAGLAARDWLTQAVLYFEAREQALGITAAQGDASRITTARLALTDDALHWHTSVPAAQRPQTWAAFSTAFVLRFCSVSTEQARSAELRKFVAVPNAVRSKLNADGMARVTTQFLQLAGQIPDERMTAATKRELLMQILPPRYAEMVLEEDAKPEPRALHVLVQAVLAKASFKAFAGVSASSAAAAPSPDAMQVDAISLAAATFGWSREEAAAHLADAEGWAAHDTDSSTAAGSPAARSSAGGDLALLERLERAERTIAAFASRPGAGGDHHRPSPSGMAKEVPAALANERKAVGLCIKCGVAKYVPGPDGHNARVCKAAVDKSTTVAAGKKKAGLSF
jgi:hypothetical protein